jgi:imidazolonepropionase-like amidohydrolase
MTLVLADRVWDGTADAVIDRGFVAIDGATIAAVGRQADLGTGFADHERVELPAGATVVPGLIDCHQHLIFNCVGTLEEQVAGIDDETLTNRARAAAARALAGGVTTLRDLGDRGFVTLGLRDDPSLPTILAAGPPLTRLGGHCWYLGGECTGKDELRRAVRERAERGCDVVKVMVTGGSLTPTFPMSEAQFSADEVTAIVDEADRAGLPVAAHCHGVAGIVQALDAGVDTIEHCSFMTASGKSEPVDTVLERLAVADVAISLTLGRLPGMPPPPSIAAHLPVLHNTLGRVHAMGATIVAGSDAGIAPLKPHDVLPHAMNDFSDAGIGAVDGLRALTSVAAKVLGVAGRKGALAPHYDADLIAVDGDPISDPQSLANVSAVWRGGVRVNG